MSLVGVPLGLRAGVHMGVDAWGGLAEPFNISMCAISTVPSSPFIGLCKLVVTPLGCEARSAVAPPRGQRNAPRRTPCEAAPGTQLRGPRPATLWLTPETVHLILPKYGGVRAELRRRNYKHERVKQLVGIAYEPQVC